MAVVGLTASAVSHTATFHLSAGSAAELRLMNYTTGGYDVIKELNAGDTEVTLNDNRYFLFAAEGRVLEYVKDNAQNNLSIEKNGCVVITFKSDMSSDFYVSTSLAPDLLPTNIIVEKGSSATLKQFNASTDRYENLQYLLQGDNELNLSDGYKYYIAPGPDHTLVKVVDNKGTELPFVDSEFGKVVSIEASAETVAESYTVTTDGPPPVDPWMKPFTMDIDDADAITVSLSPSYTPLEIKSGKNNYYFDTSRGDMGVWIVTKNYRDLYSVKLNDFTVRDATYCALVYIGEGDHVEIRYNYPDDLYYTYTLNYTDQADFWTRITVDGEDYTPVNNQIRAKAGALIQLWNDKADEWNIDYITLPSGITKRGPYGYPYTMDPAKPIEFFATYATKEITVAAHRYGDITVNFNITGQQFVKILNGSGESLTEITGLKEGANAVTDHEGRFQTVKIVPRSADEGFISSVVYRTSANGALQSATYDYDLKGYVLNRLGQGATVDITAFDRASTFNITVNVNSPRDVVLYSDASLSEESRIKTYLNSGANTVPFPADKPNIYVAPAGTGSYIQSVTYIGPDDTSAISAGQAGGAWYIANVREGGTLTILAGHTYDFKNQCTVYVDDAEKVTLRSPDDRFVALDNGHNTIEFNESENTSGGRTGFIISVAAGESFSAFKNGEPVAKSADSDTSAEVVLNQGDAIKIYTLKDAPANVTATFTSEKGDFVNLTRDVFSPVESWSEPISVLPGTRFSFTAPENGSANVIINNVAWRPDRDGVYRFDVVNNTTVNMIFTPNGDSIDSIATDTADTQVRYFDLQGRSISAGELRPGLYIKVCGSEVTKEIVR